MAADGERGPRLAIQLQPDVAIVSLDLPGMDGIATSRDHSDILPRARSFSCQPKRYERYAPGDERRRQGVPAQAGRWR